MTSYFAQIQSPVGPLLLQASRQYLTGVFFTDEKDCPFGALPPLPSIDVLQPGCFEGTLQWLELARGSDATPAHAATSALAKALLSPQPIPLTARQVLQEAAHQLDGYFAGSRKVFTLPLKPQGTVFQEAVWQALTDIPYGTTLSYRQLADKAGFSVRHSRPVGTAVGRNPLAIILPCHRILGHDGGLHGYTGGLSRKHYLLQLEGVLLI